MRWIKHASFSVRKVSFPEHRRRCSLPRSPSGTWSCFPTNTGCLFQFGRSTAALDAAGWTLTSPTPALPSGSSNSRFLVVCCASCLVFPLSFWLLHRHCSHSLLIWNSSSVCSCGSRPFSFLIGLSFRAFVRIPESFCFLPASWLVDAEWGFSWVFNCMDFLGFIHKQFHGHESQSWQVYWFFPISCRC